MTDTDHSFRIRGIPAELVDHFWKLAEPYIKRALEHANGEFTPDDLRHFCKDRTVQLWLVNEGEKVIGAATTEIVNYPAKKHCRIITVAGSRFQEWALDLDIILCAWAKEHQCKTIEAAVRKGFVNPLTTYGYKQKYVIVAKDLLLEE